MLRHRNHELSDGLPEIETVTWLQDFSSQPVCMEYNVQQPDGSQLRTKKDWHAENRHAVAALPAAAERGTDLHGQNQWTEANAKLSQI